MTHSHTQPCGREITIVIHTVMDTAVPARTVTAKNETVALLTYMLQHNEHHAAELDQMADNLKSLTWMQLRRRSKRQLQIFRKAI